MIILLTVSYYKYITILRLKVKLFFFSLIKEMPEDIQLLAI